MNTVRHVLNALALVFIAVAAVGLAMVIHHQPDSSSIPFTFVALFAAMPAAFHVIAALWSWSEVRNPGSQPRRLLGVSLCSVSLFAWVVAGSAFVELAVRDPMRPWQWQHIALVFAVVVLPLSSAVNLHHFRQSLSGRTAE